MKCAVEGTVKLPGTVEFTVAGDLQYMFVADQDRSLREIILISPVSSPEKFTSSYSPPADGNIGQIEIEMDDQLVETMRGRLQALESHLAFRLPVSKIRWDSAHFELVFESEEESIGHVVLSLQVDRASAIRDTAEASVHSLGASIEACARFATLTTLLAFIREGNNEFVTFRFINAFYNFYFVLEGLYGGGARRNLERIFVRSPAFVRAVASALEVLERGKPKAYRKVLLEIAQPGQRPDVANVAKFLVKQRGRLHHFGNRGRPDEPTPFSHDRFESSCTLARAVAICAVTEEMAEITRRDGSP